MKKNILIALLTMFCSVVTLADEPFRNHRYDSFKALKINERSIVFVGNSITDMHNWNEALGNDSRIINRGNSGAVSAEVLANIGWILRGHPAQLFMMIGTNDIGGRTSIGSIVENIRATMKRISKESPQTKVYLESLLPSTNGSRTTAAERQLNDSIQVIANEFGATYIDLFSPLEPYMGDNYSGPSAYSMDNLHMGAAGYEIWLQTIKPYLPQDIQITYPVNTASLTSNGGLSGSFGMRTTMFSMYPVEADDILFFGDEMVKCGEWNELMGNSHIKNRGTNWGYEGQYASLGRVSAEIDACIAQNGIKKMAPRRILLYTGVGDINGNTDITIVENNYQALVEKLHKAYPNTRISVLSLLPTTGYSCTRVTEFNGWLQTTLDAQDKLVDYIDIYSAVGGKVNPVDFPAGNNYLGGIGYYHVAKEIAKNLSDYKWNMLSEEDVQNLIIQK